LHTFPRRFQTFKAEEEEEEAMLLQARQAEELDAEDFGLPVSKKD
jgi:hypothetical protein